MPGLSALRTLQLTGNIWPLDFHSTLAQLPHLRRLCCTGACARLPVGLSRLTGLEELQLEGLEETDELDAALPHLTCLTSL